MTIRATVTIGNRRVGLASEMGISETTARSIGSRRSSEAIVVTDQGGEMLDEVRRLALFGSGVAELTRHQAEQIVKDLVKAGDVRRQQASTAARDLYDRSRENRKQLTSIVRSEIQNQV